jgi:hypothetical protein
VTAPVVATATALIAGTVSIAQSGVTQLTATVRAAAGSAAPLGSVTFTAGKLTLGSAALAVSGASATASLTVKGSVLTAGSNTITATYGGSPGFVPSSGTAAVTVGSTTASSVAIAASKATSSQQGFPVKIQLQETGGAPTTLTGFTINGTNFTSVIGGFFGSTAVAAHATESSTMVIQWTPLPATLVFVIGGVDASGRQWSQTATLATK